MKSIIKRPVGNIRGLGYDMAVWNVIKRTSVPLEISPEWMCTAKYGNLI